MARKKEYNEEEVVQKAMNLFCSKHGLFLESLKKYKTKVNAIFEEFKNSNNGIEDIKDFFYNSINICKIDGNQKGI